MKSQASENPSSARPLLRAAALACAVISVFAQARASDDQSGFERFAIAGPSHSAGQAVTLLPDGRWLFSGGVDSEGKTSDALFVEDAVGTTAKRLPMTLAHGRSGHTATVLPDGTVFVFGGRDATGALLATAEILDPAANTVVEVPDPGLHAREGHVATLLTTGELIVAGGRGEGGALVEQAEIWDPITGKATPFVAPLLRPRTGPRAALLSNGGGLVWGGEDAGGEPLTSGELFDPHLKAYSGVDPYDTSRLPLRELEAAPPRIEQSIPAAEAGDVPVETRVAVRFSKAIDVSTVNGKTFTLIGPSGPVAGKAVGAEAGMLAFFSPRIDLLPGTTYTAFLSGVADSNGRALPFISSSFTTHRYGVSPAQQGATAAMLLPKSSLSGPNPPIPLLSLNTGNPSGKIDPPISPAEKRTKRDTKAEYEDWIPTEENRHGSWKVLGLAEDPSLDVSTGRIPDLSAPNGVTALAGRLQRLNGKPLAGVPVSTDGKSTSSDTAGRFLLTGISPGVHQLKVDGTAVTSGGRHYTKHFIQVTAVAGKTAVLRAPVFLPRVDPATEVSIASPADHEYVLTHPAIPGLEVIVPAGAVLREFDGKIVTKLSITPIPVDRPPYPTPVNFSVYFSLQPGGAFLDGDPKLAVKVIYPNYQHLPAGSVVNFWNYDPGIGGWQIYGKGVVSPDGSKVIPDAGLGFRQIMSFGIGLETGPTKNPPPNGPVINGSCSGDPVDCATGLFIHQVTDLAVRDVIPLSVSRIYRQGDNYSRAFGIGTDLSYNAYLYAPNPSGATVPPDVFLMLAGGSGIHFTLQSGSTLTTAVWKVTDSLTAYQGAILRGVTSPRFCWQITLLNKTVLILAAHSPNQLSTIVDANGDVLSIGLAAGNSGNIAQVTSPGGRYIQFAYDSLNRIVQAIDNLGRTTSYSYDTGGRLASATDAGGKVESYAYDSSNNMTSVTDKRGNVKVTNVYDANGRVSQQTLADGAAWRFSYAIDGNTGNVKQTTITDPRGYVTQETFNAKGYTTQVVKAVGQAVQQTYFIGRDTANHVLSVRDPLGRTTAFQYDALGGMTSRSRLNGTSGEVDDAYTYESSFHKPESYTDPLGHVTRLDHDGFGNLVGATDPLGHTVSVSPGGAGLPAAFSDALGNTTQLGYLGTDLASITDPLGRKTTVFSDDVGRPVSIFDPLRNEVQYSFDPMDRVTQVQDSLSGVAAVSYDAAGNQTGVTTPRGGTYGFAYDVRNRLQSSTDPLGRAESYQYDGLGNLTRYTDRKGQVTTYTYDPLNRISTVTFDDQSTIALTWDAGNRLITISDSLNGTISHQYDGLDRLTSETTPQGTVTYSYDASSRRTGMTVSGAPPTSYTYDDASRLVGISQGSASVALTYDAANRRTGVTLPNGLVVGYSFSSAGELSNIRYIAGNSVLGSIAYSYDNSGRIVGRQSSIDRSGLSATAHNFTYNSANQLTQSSGQAFTYDANGNLTFDGTNTYTWNVRNQLTAFSGGLSFGYDALGRRTARTNGSGTTNFLYDGLNLVQDQNGSVPIADYLTGLKLDERFARTDSTATQSYLVDALGSTIALTNQGSAISTSYAYDPYGNMTSSGAASANPFGYAGRESDGGGLYFNRARYLNSGTGRFISSDPIGLMGGINTYAYAGGDPISNADPTGLLTACEILYLNNTYGTFGGFVTDTFNLQQFIPGQSEDLKGAYWTLAEVASVKGTFTYGAKLAGSLTFKYGSFRMGGLAAALETTGATASGVLELVSAAFTPFATAALIEADNNCDCAQ